MNKINYQLELDGIINSFSETDRVPTLLLHSCCAPCSSYVITYLMQYFKITVFYYNPNIFPEEEYEHRLNEQKRLIHLLNTIDEFKNKSKDIIDMIELPYDHNEFLYCASGLENEREGGKRCTECFKLRLNKTFELAAEKNFDYYGTTLTVSPHKNVQEINRIGIDIIETNYQNNGNKKTIWLPSDFKKREGYKISIDLSEKFDLYRQNYCGCEYGQNRYK